MQKRNKKAFAPVKRTKAHTLRLYHLLHRTVIRVPVNAGNAAQLTRQSLLALRLGSDIHSPATRTALSPSAARLLLSQL